MYKAPTKTWYLERIIRLVAGSIILAGIVLAFWVSQRWLLLPTLVGINLIIFALTGRCLMANMLIKIGYQPLHPDNTKYSKCDVH